ncbi:hypothetical protein NPIL_26841 [Nephila pilipes]|uniref:Uncharacterized protein n=1 Tax=Nephila pilipes TaxID=299642 RepID=A0A8X6R1E8_NEPPI|nr:hypothetical protein NPIL_26841 [Nephila pilipes]
MLVFHSPIIGDRPVLLPRKRAHYFSILLSIPPYSLCHNDISDHHNKRLLYFCVLKGLTMTESASTHCCICAERGDYAIPRKGYREGRRRFADPLFVDVRGKRATLA